jgi:hypothetical protein
MKGNVVILSATLVLSNPVSAAAISSSSSFDIDTDGWSVTEVFDDGTNVGSWEAFWGPTAGLSGGGIYRPDVGSGGTVFVAPAEFLGDQSMFLHGNISWDIMNNVSNAGGTSRWNLMLVGTDMRIVHWDTPPSVPWSWVHFDAPLEALSWTMVVDSSNWDGEVTQSEFLAVLSNLEGAYFAADWGWGADTSHLDNVSLSSVPLPTSMLLFLSGIGILKAFLRAKGKKA